jgi:transcriptional regulator of aroF, aroG, tyrA and aromatic amino acid transport
VYEGDVWMNSFVRLELETRDRMGITVDILKALYDKNINLVSMEVFTEKVCLKIKHIPEEELENLKRQLYGISDVVSIKETELLHYERNEKSLLAVIDAVDEGIMAINRDNRVYIYNKYCQELFGYEKSEALGMDIRDLIGQGAPIVELMKKGVQYDNLKYSCRGKNGTIHYLTTGRPIKNDDNETIGAIASIKDMKKARELVKIISTPAQKDAFKGIVGTSRCIQQVKKNAAAVAVSSSTIILRGESGTGKELFARAIHTLSDRRDSELVTINCAALPETLLESELFGYEKGSFTGAMQNGKEGLFKQAHKGTLFLDEVGELPLQLQAKLLRALQDGAVRKIGGTRETQVDVRIIAATNKNLEEMMAKGAFREDLYYRLNVIPIFVPSLRERLEDIPSLTQYFIDRLNSRLNKNIRGAQHEFITQLMRHDWPGNVRELKNVIERAMNLCDGEVLTTNELIIDVKDYIKRETHERELLKEGETLSLKEQLESYEKSILQEAIAKKKSLRGAAELLGVSHTTVMNKLKKYNIECK